MKQSDTPTPRTRNVIDRGMAQMKAAGMNTQKVYDTCAVFVRELGGTAISLERDLSAAQERIKELEGALRFSDEQLRDITELTEDCEGNPDEGELCGDDICRQYGCVAMRLSANLNALEKS